MLPPPNPAVAHLRNGESTPEELEIERRVYRRAREVRAEVTELIWVRLADRWQRGGGG